MPHEPHAVTSFPPNPDPINRRAEEIGREMLELAHSAEPSPLRRAWWLEKMTQWVDSDPHLKTRAFSFVDCLPALATDAALVDHLAQYLDPSVKGLPTLAHRLIDAGRHHPALQAPIAAGARFGARQMASRFITGYDTPSVVRTLESLRRQCMAFTLDVLGEFTTSDAQADRYARAYLDLLDQLAPIAAAWRPDTRLDRQTGRPMERLNFSIKVSSLDPHFDAIAPERSISRVLERLRPILLKARNVGALVNIDLESFKYHDITYALFENVLMDEAFRDWSGIGIVVQAYLREAHHDLDRLLQWARRRGQPFAIRLVKGAYWDAETAAAVRSYKTPPVWTNKWQSDACYEQLTGTMLKHTDLIRPCFASHNVRSLAVVLAYAESFGLGPGEYELQMLFGMGDPLKQAVVDLGQCLRVYCPYGDLMPGMGYLIRRLLENTSNEGFVKQGFGDVTAYDRLLTDPAIAQPSSGPMPARHYQNSDPEEPMSSFTNASNTNFSDAGHREKMVGAIAYVRGERDRHYPLCIGGEAVSTRPTLNSVNPADPDETIGVIAQASKQNADHAVRAARTAFESWRATTAANRADLLRQAADRLEMRRFELAATMILEVGKPWREADADVTEAVDHFRYYADQIEQIEARPRLRNLPGEDNRLVYAPKGVCAVIAPWSFPLAILSGMTSAALAAGNTVVVKPAQQAAVIGAKLVEILHNVGFPGGVVNYLPGSGEEVGAHLVAHPDVNVVAFTGSQRVGSQVLRRGCDVGTGQTFIRKLIVEMGGKNAVIVDDDADLDGAVQAVIESAFSYAGQKCSSCSRVIVLQGVHDAFLARLREAAQSLPIGPAELPSTVVGPVIDEAAQTAIESFREDARSNAKAVFETPVPGSCRKGYYVAPTILADVAPRAPIAQEEVFGPILAMFRADSFDHALQIANGTRYALTGGVFSRNPANIRRAGRDFAVGNLYINRKITGSQVDAQPFGGFKFS
ncbi:MAG: proline dehydrogenase family protein, partial [Phycisphaerae bacterium]